MRDFDGDPERGDCRNGPGSPHKDTGDKAKDREVERFGDAKEEEQEPGDEVRDTAMEGEIELNPVTDAEPITDTGSPAEEETAAWPQFARERHEERREGDGGEIGEIGLRKE